MTVRPITRTLFSAPLIGFRSPFNVVGHQQVEPAIFVVIKPTRTGRPSTVVGDCSFCSDVSESPIAVVVIKNGRAIASHIQVGIPIVVEVSDRDALTVMSLTTDTSFLCDVGEGSVSVVVIKGAT